MSSDCNKDNQLNNKLDEENDNQIENNNNESLNEVAVVSVNESSSSIIESEVKPSDENRNLLKSKCGIDSKLKSSTEPNNDVEGSDRVESTSSKASGRDESNSGLRRNNNYCQKVEAKCVNSDNSQKTFIFLPTFALPIPVPCRTNLPGCSNNVKHGRGTHTSSKHVPTSCFHHRFLVTIAPPVSRCCRCRRRREIRRVKENEDVRKRGESTSTSRNNKSKRSSENLTSMTRLEQSCQMKHEKSGRFFDNNNQPEDVKGERKGEISEKELKLTTETSHGRSGSKRRKKTKRRHRSSSSSSSSSVLSRASAVVGEGNNISRKSSKKHRKGGKAKKSKRSRRRASKEQESRKRKTEKSSKKKKKKRRYHSGSPKRKKVKPSSVEREVIPCCCHSCPSSNEEEDRGMETPPPMTDSAIQLFSSSGALVSLPNSCKLPTINLGHFTQSVTKGSPLGMFCLQVGGNHVDEANVVTNEENKTPPRPEIPEEASGCQDKEPCLAIASQSESSPRKTNGFKEAGVSNEKENGNKRRMVFSPSRSSLGSKSKSRSCSRSGSRARSPSRSKSRSKHNDSSPEILSNRDSRSRSSSRSASLSVRSFSSRSNSSTGSRSSSRSRSRPGSYSSRSWSRSASNTSKSRNSRSVSRSKSRSKSRSGSSSTSRSRSRSRSLSIPRRRGSPSFLDRRRITSARKRPIPYKRKAGSEWEVSSDSSDTSF